MSILETSSAKWIVLCSGCFNTKPIFGFCIFEIKAGKKNYMTMKQPRRGCFPFLSSTTNKSQHHRPKMKTPPEGGVSVTDKAIEETRFNPHGQGK